MYRDTHPASAFIQLVAPCSPWYPYWHGCYTVAGAAECRSNVTGSIVISLQTLLFPLHHCDIHELELELEARAGAANALGPGEWTLEHGRWRMEDLEPGRWRMEALEHGRGLELESDNFSGTGLIGSEADTGEVSEVRLSTANNVGLMVSPRLALWEDLKGDGHTSCTSVSATSSFGGSPSPWSLGRVVFVSAVITNFQGPQYQQCRP